MRATGNAHRPVGKHTRPFGGERYQSQSNEPDGLCLQLPIRLEFGLKLYQPDFYQTSLKTIRYFAVILPLFCRYFQLNPAKLENLASKPPCQPMLPKQHCNWQQILPNCWVHSPFAMSGPVHMNNTQRQLQLTWKMMNQWVQFGRSTAWVW